MTDFVHCNKCFVRAKQQPAAKFFITSCYHLICEKCRGEGISGSPCKICSKPMKAIEINRSLDKVLQELFMSPKQFIAQRMASLKKKQDFQKMMLSSLLGYYKQQKSKLDQAMQYFQKQASMMKDKEKEITELKQWLATAEQKLSLLEAERDNLQRELGEMQQNRDGSVNCNFESSIDRLFASTGMPEGNMPQFSLTQSFEGDGVIFQRETGLNDSLSSSNADSVQISLNSPSMSNSSVTSEITTPKILGLGKCRSPRSSSIFAQSRTTPRSNNPYMDVFNRSVPRSSATTPSSRRTPVASTTPSHRTASHTNISAFSPGLPSHRSIIPKSNTPSGNLKKCF